MRRPGALQGALLLSPALLLFGYFYIYPLARLVGTSFLGDAGDGGLTLTAENYQKFFVSPFYLSVMGQTLKISAIVTVLTILLGYPVAYLLSNLRQAAVNRLLILILLPFWTSLLVRTYAWTVLLQNRGVINSTLMEAGVIERPLPLIFNEQSVVIGTTHIMLPFMILPIYAVLKGLDPAFRRAALGLGATPLRTFWHVTLPLSLPGMAAGALIVFIMTLGFFVTPALLGGGKVILLAMTIEKQINNFLNWDFAAALAVILLAVTVLIVGVLQRALRMERLWLATR